MAKYYTAVTAELMGSVKDLSNAIPDIMTGFFAVMDNAWKDGALSKKTKELIGLALAVAAG